MTTEIRHDEKQLLDVYQKLRRKVRTSLANRRAAASPDKPTAYERLVGSLALLPDLFHLVIKLLFDRSVSARHKVLLGAMAAYILNPIDIIPDFIPVVGYLDDLVVLALGCSRRFSKADEKLAAAARRHWAGEGDVFEAVQSVVSTAESAAKFLPKRFMTLARKALK